VAQDHRIIGPGCRSFGATALGALDYLGFAMFEEQTDCAAGSVYPAAVNRKSARRVDRVQMERRAHNRRALMSKVRWMI